MTTAAVRRLAVPSPDELVERARAMVPEIRALAEETERNRTIFPHIIDKFREAELLRTSRAYLGAFITPPDQKPPHEGAFFLLPIGDCEIIDNWFVNGLAGTGSKDIAVNDVFVPARRILLFSDARAGTTPGARYHRNPLYKMPLLIHGASMLASTAVGAARGALDAYLEMTG